MKTIIAKLAIIAILSVVVISYCLSRFLYFIVNFDSAGTSLIVACCVDKNQQSKQKDSKVKEMGWPFISIQVYKNSQLLIDIDNLHNFSNSIQHGNDILSDTDINRYSTIVKDLFVDI